MKNIITIDDIEHSFQGKTSTLAKILTWISLIFINAINGYLIHVIKNKMNSLLDWLILMDCILCIFNCISLIKHGIFGKSLENIPMCFFFNLNAYFINVSNKLVTIGISIYRYVFVVHYISMHNQNQRQIFTQTLISAIIIIPLTMTGYFIYYVDHYKPYNSKLLNFSFSVLRSESLDDS